MWHISRASLALDSTSQTIATSHLGDTLIHSAAVVGAVRAGESPLTGARGKGVLSD